MFKGIAASAGIGIGRVLLVEEAKLEYTPHTVEDTAAEAARFHDAVETLIARTRAQAEALAVSAGAEEAEILLGHISMMQDPYLCGETEKLIAGGQCAEAAFESMCDMFIMIFSQAEDELTRQRAADVRDVKRGLLGVLLGVREASIADVPAGTVLLTRELTPSMTAGIRRGSIVGIVTETGGETAHAAILARALEIPAVLSVENACAALKSGDLVIVDGSRGTVTQNPSEAVLDACAAEREAIRKEQRALEAFRGRETKDAAGEAYQLLCNISQPEDVGMVLACDGEGVGLFRTEFLFLNRAAPPSEEEQFAAYRKAALALGGRPLIIRTLDIGGDKDLPGLGRRQEENPFLGLRAIRRSLKHRALFQTQLRAILRASAFGDVKLLLPLITCVEELREAKALLSEAKSELRRAENAPFNEHIEVGVMVETAAAAVIADLLAREADFFSIGTNDLTGYTMACDRGNADVAYLHSALQPGVLRLIRRAIETGRRAGIPVGMCGEAAADPRLTPLLISFGLTAFSVSAPSVLKVRRNISRWTKAEADKVTTHAMRLDTEAEIAAYLQSVM